MPASHHILLVDDHDAVRRLGPPAGAALSNCDDHPSPHGAAALSLVAQHNLDLIITDHQMPIMSGLQLVRTLRAQGLRMPIVALSSDTSTAEAIVAAGATAFLPKPFFISRRSRSSGVRSCRSVRALAPVANEHSAAARPV
jgi:CheY-like chemotaxis protein